jgi:DNA-binding Lrp family transcriptional regulator
MGSLLRELKFKIFSELMKNSRTSDRELAKKVGCSPPTVTRIRQKLEQDGVIKEYTIIPDFGKLGFGLMALTFSRFTSTLNEKKRREVKKYYRDKTEEERAKGKSASQKIVMQEQGKGLGYSGVTISFHENYESFVEFTKQAELNAHVELKNVSDPNPILEIDKIESFLIDLNSKTQFHPLTLSRLARYISTMKHASN